jgi:hypothetical protein
MPGQLFVSKNVILCHARCSKALLATAPHARPVDLVNPSDRPQSLFFSIDDESGDTVFDDLSHRARAERNARLPQAMASMRTRPNGSGQLIGNSRADAFWRNSALRCPPISPKN